MMYFRSSRGEVGGGGVGFEALHELAQLGARELPAEGSGDLFVVPLEAEDTVGEGLGRIEVIGREHLPLEDRVVDLDLVPCNT